MNEPTPAGSPTGTTTGGERAPLSSFYTQLLAQATTAAAAGELETALAWLRQAEFVGLVVMKESQTPEVTEAYAGLVAQTCRRMRQMALYSGNITVKHQKLAAMLETASERLRIRLKDGDAVLLARAATIEGFASQLNARIGALRSAYSHVTYWPTSAALLDSVIDDLTSILAQVKELGFKLEPVYGPSKEILTLSGTCVENARHSLSWFWSSKLSDWDKAAIWLKRASQLLSQHIAAEGKGATGSRPDLDRLFDAIAAAEKVVKARNYGDSAAKLEALDLSFKALAA